MKDSLELLHNRNSAPKLTEPGPTPEQLQAIFRAALRAPDHAWLRPWRFITIAGQRRRDFGEVLERSLLARNPEADEAAREKARNSALRAPVMVAVVVRLSEHPKVPHVEQRLSAGCAAHAMLLAAEAQGLAGIWRTGDAAIDRNVMDALWLSEQEELVGFIYLGTRTGRVKPIPDLDAADFVSNW